MLDRMKIQSDSLCFQNQCFRPRSIFDITDASPWHDVLQALFITNNGLNKIVLDSADFDLGVKWKVFSMTAVQAYHARRVLPNLVKLKLLLAFDDDNRTGSDFSDLKKSLSWATCLEDLDMEICDRTSRKVDTQWFLTIAEEISACLEMVKVPKLKTLALSGFELQEETLVSLFSTTPDMHRLSLHYVLLIAGSWSSLVKRIRQLLEFVSIDVFRLGYEEEHGIGYVFSDGDIDLDFERYKALNLELEQYFRHKGRNPFNRSEYNSENSL